MSTETVQDIVKDLNDSLDETDTKFKFKQFSCGLFRDISHFNNKDDLTDECGKGKCTAHYTSIPACSLIRQDIESNKPKYMMTTGLCISCLQRMVCCLDADHPSRDSIPHPSQATQEDIRIKQQLLQSISDISRRIFSLEIAAHAPSSSQSF